MKVERWRKTSKDRRKSERKAKRGLRKEERK